jgi:hypothetical protein
MTIQLPVIALAGLTLAGASPSNQELASITRFSSEGTFVVQVEESPSETLNRRILISCTENCRTKIHYSEKISEMPWAIWGSPLDRPIVIIVLSSGSSNIIKAYRLRVNGIDKILECHSKTIPSIMETADTITIKTREAEEASGTRRLRSFIWHLDGSKFIKRLEISHKDGYPRRSIKPR